MTKIKPPAVAGMFYSANKKELMEQLEYLNENRMQEYEYKTRAVIVPHAGYMYSGQLATEGIHYLQPYVKNVFIFAPAHKYALEGIAISSADAWETPLGNVAVNQEINKILAEKFDAIYSDAAFEGEHSAEVQVPILQTYLENFNIVPILIGAENATKICNIMSHFYDDKYNAFIISSDLSHFHTGEKAQEIDALTAEMIESTDVQKFSYEQACGAVGICGLSLFAVDRKFSLVRVGLTNSGDVTGDNERVVGYGSWLMYEGEKNQFLKQYFTDYILDVCKKSIEYGVAHNKKMTVNDLEFIPEVFNEYGACFVTLEINENLRGCIGSIVPHTNLIEDLLSNAHNAAFTDPRFKPLTKDELELITIAVSLLSIPTKMKFKDEIDLLDQIKPFVDGLIIRDGAYQAVYLPSVWEQLPDKVEFLMSLKVKAGLDAEHFSENFEAYRFHSEYIK